MITGLKLYPYTSFRFRVEIGGIIVAQVSEVTGLQLETETEAYEEGGVNNFVHQLPKRTKYQHITLKRGITFLDEMW
jgi:phage tail-like protein